MPADVPGFSKSILSRYICVCVCVCVCVYAHEAQGVYMSKGFMANVLMYRSGFNFNFKCYYVFHSDESLNSHMIFYMHS